MRDPRVLVLAFAFAVGCSAGGTAALGGDGGDATVDDGASDAAADGPGDAATEGEAAPPCPMGGSKPGVPSDDCVFTGPCAFVCAAGTASSYACNANGPAMLDASFAYPAVFTEPLDVVTLVAVSDNQYPWDAAAYVTCAPLSCVRWSTGDHVDGGSQWPGDPCSTEAGSPALAWTCPQSPGVVPPGSSCFSAGDFNMLGGVGTPLVANAVWCCPLAEDGGSPTDAAVETGAEAATDASGDVTRDAPGDAGTDGSSE